MKKILINSKSNEEIRIATLDNGKLIDLDIENVDRQQKKANIYKGYISRIEPSLNAVFVSYGEEKNGFLPFKEISEYYLKDTPNENSDNIGSLLSEGQELLVQIDKEERGDKGAALTTFIALAGSYMVLLPNNSNGGGISRRVEGEDRETIKKYLKQLNIPKSMSVIARTACVECSFEELKHDFDVLQELWESISQTYHKIKRPALLHKESDIIVRTVRDHLKDDVREIIVDSKECFDDVRRQLSLLRQNFDINKVKLYSDDLPLFASFSIDQQIENAYKREIRLPSGGSIVIDTTEALVAVDVNSSRATKADDVETTAFKTNLEAAEEVARQLRIRDLGGLVIVDFIDMSFYPNRKQVEEKFMESLQHDKARIQMSKISRLGLVEVSRQRLNSSLNESVMQKCPRCDGHGFIKTTQATALTILRKIRVEAIKEDTNEIRVQVPVDIAAYILNEKRESIVEIERISNVKIMLIPNFNLESPKFQMQRIWGSSYKSNRTSPELIEDVYNVEVPKTTSKKAIATALVDKNLKQKAKTEDVATDKNNDKNKSSKVPEKKPEIKTEKKGFISKLVSTLFGSDEQPIKKDNQNKAKKSEKNNRPQQKEDAKKDQNRKPKQNNNSNRDNKNDSSSNNKNNRANNNSNENRHQKSKDKDGDNRNFKNKRNDRNDRNNKYDNKPNSRRNDKNSRSNNITVNSAEEVVDITKEKFKNKVQLEEVNNVKKVISKNPQEYVSVMVKDVLESYENLKDNTAEKVTTQERVKTNKYLKFEVVSTKELEAEIAKKAKEEKRRIEQEKQLAKKQAEEAAKQQELEANLEVQTNETMTVDSVENTQQETESNNNRKPKRENKKPQDTADFINYSPALDAESQNIINVN